MTKKINFFGKVFVWTILIISIMFSLLIFTPLAFGLKSYKITSTSMSPIINKNDLIYIKKVDPLTLKEDDIITFHQSNSNFIVTHRISRIEKDSKLIYTIGDRNSKEDPVPIPFNDVIGKYTNIKIPWVGGL